MANQQHLAILKQGVTTWNQWRQEYPAIQPDLKGAYLVKENLPGVDFSRTNLSGAHLMGAYLRHARLNWADLRGANLSAANLESADLTGAELEGVRLACANLHNTGYVGILAEDVLIEGTGLSHSW